MADAYEGFAATDHDPYTGFSKAGSETRQMLQAGAQGLTLPLRGYRGLGVGTERLLAGDPVSQAAERAAAAIQPDYTPPRGERLGAFLGENAPLAVAGAAMPAGSAAVGAAARYGRAAAATGLGSGFFQALDEMSAQGHINPKDVAIAAGFGAIFGTSVQGAADAVTMGLRSQAAQSIAKVMGAAQKRILTELNTSIYRVKKGLGLPQETGLVPVAIHEHLAQLEAELEALGSKPGVSAHDFKVKANELAHLKGAYSKTSMEIFRDQLIRHGGASQISREAIARPVVEDLVGSGIPREVAVARVTQALDNAVFGVAKAPPVLPPAPVSPDVSATVPTETPTPERIAADTILTQEAKARNVKPGTELVAQVLQDYHDRLNAIQTQIFKTKDYSPALRLEAQAISYKFDVLSETYPEQAKALLHKTQPQPYELTIDEYVAQRQAAAKAAGQQFSTEAAKREHYGIVQAYEAAGGKLPAWVEQSYEAEYRAHQEREAATQLKELGYKQTPVLTRLRALGLNKAAIEKAGHLGNFTDIKGVLRNKGGVSLSHAAETLYTEGLIPEYDEKLLLEAIDHESRFKTPMFMERISGASGGGSGYASKGPFASGTPVEEGFYRFKGIESPELVKMIRLMLGNAPRVSRRMGPDTRGIFSGGVIKIRPEVASDPEQLAKAISHEIGHADDWLSDFNLARGNVLGRTIKSTKTFMANTWGDLATNRELREELKALSAYWRPWDRDAASSSFRSYRDSSKELYADALSVLLNSPGTLEKMAPNFYRAFFDQIDKRPEFAKAFFEIQDVLNNSPESVARMRSEDLQKTGIRGDEILKAKRLQAQEMDRRIMDRLMYQFKDKNYVAVRKIEAAEAAGLRIDPKDRIQNLLERLGMTNPTSYLQGYDLNKQVFDPMDAAGLDRHRFNEFLLANWIKNGRKDIPNPRGWTPKTAQDQLDLIRKDFGEERFELLQKLSDRFNDILFTSVERSGEVGFYSTEFVEKVARPNKYTYATIANLRHLEEQGYISPQVHEMIGTFEDALNVVDAKLMKTFALNVANERQFVKSKLIEQLKTIPNEVFPTEYSITPNGFRYAKRRRGFEAMTVSEDGKTVSYDVDPLIAGIFKQASPESANALVDLLQLKKTNPIAKAIWTHANAGFVFWNGLIRYMMSSFANTPEAGAGQYLREYVKSLPEMKAFIRQGELSPRLRKMISNFEFDLRHIGLFPDPNTDQWTYTMQKIGVLKNGRVEREGMWKVIEPLDRYLNFMNHKASELLLAHKAGTHAILEKTGIPEHELSYRVRNDVGLPNTGRKGDYFQTTNELSVFSNVLMEHYRRFANIAFMNPKTRGSYWTKAAYLSVIPAVIGWAIDNGAFDEFPGGKEAREIRGSLSRYYRETTLLIPLGKMPDGKTGWKGVGVPVPLDEGNRPIHIAVRKLLDFAATGDPEHLQRILAYAIGMLPGVAPTLSVGWNWTRYLSDQPTYDWFRGRPAIPENLRKRGGLKPLGKMIEWTVNQTGLVNLSSYDPAHRSTTEMLVQMTPLLSRIIVISDAGKREQQLEQRRHGGL